jgi:uncharacterized protein (TIGR03435 family)
MEQEWWAAQGSSRNFWTATRGRDSTDMAFGEQLFVKSGSGNLVLASLVLEENSVAKCITIIFCAALSALACNTFSLRLAQTQSLKTTTPQFEVTSVKQNVSQGTSSNISSSIPDRFVATNIPLRFLILDAYELLDHQLVGGPDWIWNKSYDVVGTYPEGPQPPAHEIHLMLQQLLADRFGLKVHHEQRELPAYELVVERKDGRLGPQIHKSGMNCATWIADGRPKTTGGLPSPVSPSGERPVCAMNATRKWLTGGARTMQDLAASLQSMLGRPVVDSTGLTGSYDIDLQWAVMDLHADEAAPSASSEGPSLFAALQEQLGLRLVSRKDKFDVLVIDQINPPSPN